jgi:hypothetical protein
MTREAWKTSAFGIAAAALATIAALVEPESRTPAILSDQGEAFYPNFTDAQAPRAIEVVGYDEATATARPFKVLFQKGRWIIASNFNYPVDIGDRLSKTAAALMDMKKDVVRSDSVQDHAACGVVDPLDQKTASLTGRGKRVTLRDARGAVLADYILGKAVDGKPGFRFVRLPGEKRTYAVRTEAEPSAEFADWVNAGLLRIASASIRKVTVNSYSIDERLGRVMNAETAVLTHEKDAWKLTGAEKFNQAAVTGMAAALDQLKIVDVRPKPPSLAQDLKSGQIRLSLEAQVSLRQRGYFLTPQGRLLANQGEMTVETANGLVYTLRFGEIATAEGAAPDPAAAARQKGEVRHLFVTVGFDPIRAEAYKGDAEAGKRSAQDLTNRFADWYYVISGDDFKKLCLTRRDLVR